MVECLVCGKDVQVVKSEKGFSAVGMCKKTGSKHLIPLIEIVGPDSPWTHD